MKTYEMVALADIDNKTYVSDDMRYSKKHGFHDSEGSSWNADAFIECGLSAFIHLDGWRLLGKQKMTVEDIENVLGYPVEIIETKFDF